jgi:hypothetical protein
MPGSYRQLDLNGQSWCQGLPARHYDVIATANALHWLSAVRAEAVFGDIHGLLNHGGTFFFAEPAIPEALFAPGFGEWKSRQPPRYDQGNWKAFWDRANSLTGYDHTQLLGYRNGCRIGDGMTVRGYADGVIVAAQRA